MTHETQIDLTVRYAETDQMGVAYHAAYLVWCDMARTAYLRERGAPYSELEAGGLLLAVTDAAVRYRGAVRYEDQVVVRCWVRDLATRKVEFGYAMHEASSGRPVATARTALIALDRSHRPTRLPEHVRELLVPIADPVRL